MPEAISPFKQEIAALRFAPFAMTAIPIAYDLTTTCFLTMAAWIERHSLKISALFGLAGIALIVFITARYGAGVSGDAVDYLSTADSLKRGAGFTDFAGEPYIYWPPLYPLLLAGLSWILGVDTFMVGGWLNAVCFGVIVMLAGVLLRKTLDQSPFWFLWGSLVVLSALPLVQLAANILSDALFIVLVLLYALWGRAYLHDPALKRLLPLSLLAATAALLRWHGVLVVAAVVVLVLIAQRRNLKIALRDAAWSGALAAFPFAGWVFGRNYRLLGSVMGYRDTGEISILYNLKDAFQKMSHWFLPDQLLSQMPPLILLGGVVVLLVLAAGQSGRQLFLPLRSADNLPWVIFFALDFGFILLTSIRYDHAAYFDDRYYAPLFVFVVLLLGQVLQTFADQFGRIRWSVAARWLFMLALSLWLLYPAYRLYKYAVVSRAQGEPTYNMYNSERFRQSELVAQLLEPSFDISQPLYSNYPAAVYFYTRQTTLRAPISSSGDPADFDTLYRRYTEWPPEGQATLIWFLPNDWHYYYHPEDLTTIAEMQIDFSSPDGVIYAIKRR